MELVVCSKSKIVNSLRTTLSGLGKLCPADATLPTVSCQAPHLLEGKGLLRVKGATVKRQDNAILEQVDEFIILKQIIYLTI